MLLRKKLILVGLFVWCLEISAAPKPAPDATVLKHISNSSYADKQDLSGIASIFSPRMDFDQWKPLTGRGDPLRNDPTYDYEPPVLERVHYWADESRLEREKYPERKSEVLVLGVSSRKPSVASRPPMTSRRVPRPPGFANKYEDFTYNFGEHYPMTILVPPPPPPAGQKPPLFILNNEKLPMPTFPPKFSGSTLIIRDTTTTPELITSYAFQESNLIYQESTLKQNWLNNINKTTNFPNNTVSSDYAGWGPTTPFEDVNDSHNVISHIDQHNIEFTKQPLSYYKPMFSQAPPSPQTTEKPFSLPTFLPTAIPPMLSPITDSKTWPPISEEITQESSTETQQYFTEIVTEKSTTQSLRFIPTPTIRPKPNIIDMLSPMISMPMVTDPDRPEDHLYAHASNTVQIFKEQTTEEADLEKMQTMQPPPPVKFPESTTPSPKQPFHINPHILKNLVNDKTASRTHDPYLHMRFTTPVQTTPATIDLKSTTETQTIPMYLIIQGHSKVKTYGSKPKPLSGIKDNEIPNPNETNEVKHLHPIKVKYSKKNEKIDTNRESRAINLKTLVDNGLGSIEIQEADVGIKYDVSDGGKVPVDIYRKGIVDNDENDYSYKNKLPINERKRKKMNIENKNSSEDTFEDVVYDLFTNQKNQTEISELISETFTNDDSSISHFGKTDDSSNETTDDR